MHLSLTDEQQRIVEHSYGPALVFAVAGAGKTTTMVRRIERVVRENIFAADRILASSFSRASVADIKQALKPFVGTARVQVRTLHGLGYAIIREAIKRELVSSLELPKAIESVAYAILSRTLRTARARNVAFHRDLNSLDSEDFFAYVASCKAELSFADLKAETLPRQSKAKQAVAPNHNRWYLELFQIFEEERKAMAVLTFDDLIPQAWTLLIKHKSFRESYQTMFDAVMVDEFQDMNLGQVELLDLLVETHGNYFVVGDDDQCLYSWRGTSNEFILTFDKRYKAKRYVISDNFRCFAEHTVLANHVIARNTKRTPKTLCPARGFGGQTRIETHKDNQAMGNAIAKNIKEALKAGEQADQIAILVRLYAETAFIEYGLIEQDIPYEIIGNVPFYDRSENKLLLKYFYIAQFERQLQEGNELSSFDQQLLGEIWWDVLRTPKRYLSREQSDNSLREVLVRGTAPTLALSMASGHLPHGARESILSLSRTIAWLVEQIASDTKPAFEVLQELEARLEYKSYLLENSGFAETGEGKVQNVQAFIEYAQAKGSVSAFLAHLEKISFGSAGSVQVNTSLKRVVISSVFRAKGLQWPHVIVPGVNYGHYPAAGVNIDLSEERRLFYVALTRTQANLELHLVSERQPSIFMEGLVALLKDTRLAEASLNKDLASWEAQDALNVMKVYRYLERYLEVWHDAAQDKQLLASWLVAADKAWRLVSEAVLPKSLVNKLQNNQVVDETKVAACKHCLQGTQTIAKPPNTVIKAIEASWRPYSKEKDGALPKGTRVRHALHGEGQIVGFGSDPSFAYVDIAFDKGRTVRLLLQHARFEVATQ